MMDYSEVLIKIQIGVKDLHEAINSKDWLETDIQSDNLVFLAKQIRDSVADLHTK
jgi:hypothetical protein